MPNITSLSNSKKEFQTPNMKIPVILHASENLLPNEETFEQLEYIAEDERFFHHIAAMSDVHPKKGRKAPTGTVAASEHFLFPQINDTAPNCGMRFLKTDLDENNTPPEKIDELFKELVKVIPTKKLQGVPIPYQMAVDIARDGIHPLTEYFQTRTKNEIENSYEGGNFFRNDIPTVREILDVVPKLFLKIAQHRLGILGAAGNHFLDLMKITEIKNSEVAQKFGLRPGQYIFLMHTGSGLVGQYVSYMYTPKAKEHKSQKMMLELGISLFDSQLKKVYKNLYQKIKKHEKLKNFFGYEDSSLEGRMFINAHRASANFGFANRTVLTDQIDKAMERVFGRQVSLDMLYDSPHISIEKENHFEKDVWVHRNGSVRANGSARMQHHPIFKETGEPVFIPSSMATPAYLGVGTDENVSTFFSAGHGTGRRRNPNPDTPENKKKLFDKVREKKVKLYNAQSKEVILQDSAYYKDVEEVISGMVENRIINVVAKMEPVAVLMY
ncbi:MAG: RtcB family protein [Parcubacteria group bacterium]|jgi:tRNA-splicing ligase RtcB